MTVMIDRISLREIQEKAARQRESLTHRAKELSALGASATKKQASMLRALETALKPQ